MYLYMDSDGKEDMFRESLKEEAEELSASAFGGTLLYTIGLSYRWDHMIIMLYIMKNNKIGEVTW